MLSKWNFKKIAVWYLVRAVITGVLCEGTVGYLYRQWLKFAWQYARLEEAKTPEAPRTAAGKRAAASEDVVDILVVDENRQGSLFRQGFGICGGPPDIEQSGRREEIPGFCRLSGCGVFCRSRATNSC